MRPLIIAIILIFATPATAKLWQQNLTDKDLAQFAAGKYTQVKGDIILTNTAKLDYLARLERVAGSLIIGDLKPQTQSKSRANKQLTTISHLDNLVYIGNALHIVGNAKLQQIASLPKLATLKQLLIEYNPQLKNLGAYPSLLELDNLRILGNNKLANLAGIGSIQNMQKIIVQENAQLSNIDDLGHLKAVNVVNINNNSQLKNYRGLQGIKRVEKGLVVLNNPQVTTLHGLENLSAIGDKAQLIISDHQQLNNLDALSTKLLLSLKKWQFVNRDNLETAQLHYLQAARTSQNSKLSQPLLQKLSIDELQYLQAELYARQGGSDYRQIGIAADDIDDELISYFQSKNWFKSSSNPRWRQLDKYNLQQIKLQLKRQRQLIAQAVGNLQHHFKQQPKYLEQKYFYPSMKSFVQNIDITEFSRDNSAHHNIYYIREDSCEDKFTLSADLLAQQIIIGVEHCFETQAHKLCSIKDDGELAFDDDDILHANGCRIDFKRQQNKHNEIFNYYYDIGANGEIKFADVDQY